MKEIRVVLYIVILLVLNACQGRDILMMADLKSTHGTKTSQSTIVHKQRKKLNIIVTEKKKSIPKKKSTQASKHTSSIQKQKDANRLKIIQPKKQHKNPSIKGLPPLPNLEKNILDSIQKSKQKKKPITKPKDNSIDDIINTKVSQYKKSFSGGDILNNLDMATIRVGKSSDYTSIIFDSYNYEGEDIFPSKKSSASGIYLFTYEPSKNRIVGLIDGYNAFSALLSDQRELFSDNKVVKNIYILKRLGEDGIKFAIKLRKNVRVNIFNVKKPGRIIVNLFPI